MRSNQSNIAAADLDDVIVALVEERAQHPNADKLSLCRVNNGREILSVVCGAQNFKSGDKVALAQVGATLPGDFKIKRSKIRGEESCGMLCSEKELALADESAGHNGAAGRLCRLVHRCFEALGIKDAVFEIGLTPNRADVYSRRAVEMGINISINRDAHSTETLGQCEFGVATARRGWVPAKSVLNTWNTADLLGWLKNRGRAAA